MTVHGVDYTAGRLSAAQLRAADMEFAGRYIGRTTRLPAKFATKDEVEDFDHGGIGLVLFFEDGPQRALGGAAAGRADAQFVAQQCAALGVPDHPVLYTVDFPATVEQIGGPIAEYFATVVKARGLRAAGCYGSYDTVRILLDRRLATYACQTPAWSGGRRDPRAQLYQGDPEHNAAEQTTVAGITCDVLTALADDYGQGDDVTAQEVWGEKLPVTAAIADSYNFPAYTAADWMRGANYWAAQAAHTVAALSGQIAGLTTAVAALAAPGGVDVPALLAQVQAAAQAGTEAALHQALSAGADATEPTP